MRKIVLVIALFFTISSSLFAISDSEKNALMLKYMSGGKLSKEDLSKIGELKKEYESKNKKSDEATGKKQEKDLKKNIRNNKQSGANLVFYQKYYFNGNRLPYQPSFSNLKPFGYDTFKTPSTYAPLDNVPVSDNYIIGPGDVLHITFLGGTSQEYDVKVDRNGRISSPDLGVIYVAGLTFKQLKERLNKGLSTGTTAVISFSKIKTVRVYVTGDAISPGSYTVSGLSTVINALFVAGGPSLSGSMRDIQLKRSGRVVSHIDLYQFLLNGSSKNDRYLMSGDVIFIPPVKNIVAVAGNVRRPAIYELKNKETLDDLVKFAGGFTASADRTNISIKRFDGKNGRIAIDVKGDENLSKIALKDGDVVKIYPLYRNDKNLITLKGYIATPRTFEYKKGMRISDLIKPDMLLPDTYLKYATLKRKKYPEDTYTILPINLGKAIFSNKGGENDLFLQKEDIIILYSKYEMQDIPPIFVMGEVRNGGKFDYVEGMTILDAINLAGGLTETANRKIIEYVTLEIGFDKVVNLCVKQLDFQKILKNPNDYNINIKLHPFDKIYIRRVADFNENRTITLSGEIKYPGAYFAKKDDRLYDVLKRAGGFTKNAYTRGAYFTRVSIQKLQKKRLDNLIDALENNLNQIIAKSTEHPELAKYIPFYKEKIEKMRKMKPDGRLVIKLPRTLDELKSSPYNIRIEDGDTLYIPKKSEYVAVMGEVYNPNVFVYDAKKNKVKDYLKKTGGATRKGDISNAFVVKASGIIISNHYIDAESASFHFLSNKFLNAKIFPGDTLIVPEKVEKVPWITNLKDWSTVLYQLATTVKITSDLWK